MENFARVFNCAHCHQQVTICRTCDRGNIYCGPECFQLARQQSLRDAGRRYQNSRQGKLKHAARQQRYYKRKILTHQGSMCPSGKSV